MSLHQIIYTSCMRGIEGVNDGQQVFSFDASFRETERDEVKGLFSYQPPALPSGVAMTEELAAEMPRSFSYRRFDSGICALALNTYLGRDYMGSAGRFGNHLSHVIAFGEDDIDGYPCEFFGSESLRDHMEHGEVNNPDPPAFLPTPVLERGYAVTVENIIAFLSEENRLEIYKDMLCAMLSFEEEHRRVLICDRRENNVLWIAALEYALPRKTAMRIDFSTYTFDPSLSFARICGVEREGTRFNYEMARQNYTFDFFSNDYPQLEKDAEFFSFIDIAMSFSYESLQDFHRFLEAGYRYEKADAEIYDAYSLYSLLADGIGSMPSREKLIAALRFAAQHALPEERLRIMRQLIQPDTLSAGRQSFLTVAGFITAGNSMLGASEKEAFRGLCVDKTLDIFLNDGLDEEAFLAFYREMEKVSGRCGFQIATELMKAENKEKLFAVMKSDIEPWKVAFIAHGLSSCVKEQRDPVENLLLYARIG